ncbi:MAG: helix-turn-helix domain-containing protein [Lachnospiraceae bacterium]
MQKTTEFTKYTMRKLSNDEAVTTDIFVKICRDLNCMVNDTMEVLTENK